MAENTDPMPADPEEFSEDDEDEDDEHEWLLGFVEPPISRQSLLRHRFPSKVGGRPAWLDPVRLPSLTQLAGPDGATPLSFLLQVYAPVETNPAAFHRTVFVFMHPDAAVLLRPGGVKVLRGQLPLRNPYYGEAPASEEEGAPRPAGEPAGPDPWAVAQYERAWKVPGKAERPCPFLFPEAELVVEEERRSVDPEEEARELQRLMRQANIQAREFAEADGTADDEPGVMEGVEAQITDEQRDFAAFSARASLGFGR